MTEVGNACNRLKFMWTQNSVRETEECRVVEMKAESEEEDLRKCLKLPEVKLRMFFYFIMQFRRHYANKVDMRKIC